MIKNEYCEIKISKKNNNWLTTKGYEFNLGDIIIIKTKDLPLGSHKIISVICDICGKEKELTFQKYIKNVNNGDFYSCSVKCAQKKVKKTSVEKYGVEHYTQTKEYKKRYKETSLEKYGVEHHTQNKTIKEKQKKTNIQKYGVEYYTKTEEYKIKYKKKMIDKCVENAFQSEEIKEKSKKTMLKKFGVEYFTQSEFWSPHSGITSN